MNCEAPFCKRMGWYVHAIAMDLGECRPLRVGECRAAPWSSLAVEAGRVVR